MTRSFSATHLVTLPHLSSSSAVALGDRLLAVARKQPSLPMVVQASHQRLQVSHDEHRQARVYMNEMPLAEPSAAAEADVWVGTAWGALHDYLKGWERLPARGGPGAEQAERAKSLRRGLFPGGLSFLKLPHEQEWAETQKRLDRIDKPDFAAHVEALGAEPFVDAIGRAFEAYGAALRAVKLRAERAPKVREPLARFIATLRSYVLHVTTYGDLGGAGSAEQALTDELLAPLAGWQSPGGRKGKVGAGGGGDAGDDGDAGDSGGGGDDAGDDSGDDVDDGDGDDVDGEDDDSEDDDGEDDDSDDGDGDDVDGVERAAGGDEGLAAERHLERRRGPLAHPAGLVTLR